MRNVPSVCVTVTTDSVIRFGEKRSVIRFHNLRHLQYKRVQVDGCAIAEGAKCDNMLCSSDEHDEYFVELKGSDISHAIEQLRASIVRLGEYDGNPYVVCTKVAPQLTTLIQKAKMEFRKRFKSELLVKVSQVDISL